MNNSEYSAYLECQLSGFYDRETDIPPMADDPQSCSDESCPACECNDYIALGILGNLVHRRCRACGCDYSLEVE
jgi:hypothetical protein